MCMACARLSTTVPGDAAANAAGRLRPRGHRGDSPGPTNFAPLMKPAGRRCCSLQHCFSRAHENMLSRKRQYPCRRDHRDPGPWSHGIIIGSPKLIGDTGSHEIEWRGMSAVGSAARLPGCGLPCDGRGSIGTGGLPAMSCRATLPAARMTDSDLSRIEDRHILPPLRPPI